MQHYQKHGSIDTRAEERYTDLEVWVDYKYMTHIVLEIEKREDPTSLRTWNIHVKNLRAQKRYLISTEVYVEEN